MIEIQQEDWAGDRREKFRTMMNGGVMLSFMEHLIQKRDALLAESGYLAFEGSVGAADEKRKRAASIDNAIKELRSYANEVEIPGSVKIITKP